MRDLAAFIFACIISMPHIALTEAPSDITNRVARHMARFDPAWLA